MRILALAVKEVEDILKVRQFGRARFRVDAVAFGLDEAQIYVIGGSPGPAPKNTGV